MTIPLRGCSRVAAVFLSILLVSSAAEGVSRVAPSCAYPRCPLPQTRGVVRTSSKSAVCNTSTKVVRNVPPGLKKQVFETYHLAPPHQVVAIEDLVAPGAPLGGALVMAENELAESRADPNAPGSPGPKGAQYEVDHFIPLELGGSNDLANLWPQSYVMPWGAHIKDALENKLHRMVCAGQIPLAEAQAAIKSNWINAYEKYVANGN